MIGCFNISLFAYFDIHRIFDLMSYRVWDFVMWWFDLDFLLFDFNFDFIMCLSFIFLFLIHFFLKLVFSFIINYILLNNIIHALNYRILLCTNSISFITFFFSMGIHICIAVIELFITLHTICFQDFTGFFEFLSIHNKIYKRLNINSTYMYIMFYYSLNILNFLCVVTLRFFFSYTYNTINYTDYNVNIKSLEIRIKDLSTLWIAQGSYIKADFLNFYFYIHKININVLIIFTLIILFYNFTVFYVLNKQEVKVLFLKNSKYLHILSIKFTLHSGRHSLHNITYVHLFMYIIFIINYFSMIVKDFNYINFILLPYLVMYLFSHYIIDFNSNVKKWYKKQLQFITNF